MQGDDGDGGDGVRHAAESLRAARESLPDLAEGLDREIRNKVDDTTTPLDEAGLVKEAHAIRLIGTRMTADREDAFASVAHVLTGAADEIEALLRSADDGDAPPPVFSIPPPPVPAPGVVTTAQQTVVVQRGLPDNAAHRRAINQVVTRFPPKLQALARTLLFGRSSHAVERHGHHLRQEQQVARVQWRLDPAGVDGWRLNPDGSVLSQRWNGEPHQVGTMSGQYTSADAVAKPLIALLQAAGRTQAALDRYLDVRAKGKTRVKIFLSPADTGITPDDVATVRGSGADTDSGARLWRQARTGSMNGLGEPPAVRDHDTVRLGRHPGSVIMLVKRPHESWRLVTSYFMDDPEHQMSYTEL